MNICAEVLAYLSPDAIEAAECATEQKEWCRFRHAVRWLFLYDANAVEERVGPVAALWVMNALGGVICHTKT